jgi:hypothetical protein
MAKQQAISLNQMDTRGFQAVVAVAEVAGKALEKAGQARRVLFIREALQAAMAKNEVTADKKRLKQMERLLATRINDVARRTVMEVCGPAKVKARVGQLAAGEPALNRRGDSRANPRKPK